MKRKNFLWFGLIGSVLLALTLGIVLSCDDSTKDYTVNHDTTLSSVQNSNITSQVTLAGYTISSPYDDIDWETYGHYKAALHTHTTRSDGANTLSQMVEELYRQNYDVVAFTDHNATNASWVTGLGSLTQERYDEIIKGTGLTADNVARSEWRGMLMLPWGNEQSRGEHLNSFFANYNNSMGTGRPGLTNNIATTALNGGISFINHIGRYTHGSNPDRQVRIDASNDADTVEFYVNTFIQNPACVGMEIVNRRDLETYSDRILWDNILKQTIPRERNVWGFSTDDAHSSNASENGNSYTVFVMPENSVDNVEVAMTNGHFYAVALVSKIELGESFYGLKEFPPTIAGIEVDNTNGSITITTENITKIDWISDGVTIGSTTATDSTFDTSKIGSYLRANLMGPGGIAFTQAFVVTAK